MIMETNTELFRKIKDNWFEQANLKANRQYSYWELKHEFFDWIKEQGGTINRSRRKESPRTAPFAYDENTLIPGTDYIEFTNEREYLLFVLKYT